MPPIWIDRIDTLWNHCPSCLPMFVDYYIFTTSLGHIFMGNWFVALLHIFKMIKHSMICSWGRKFVGKGKPRNPRILIQNKQ